MVALLRACIAMFLAVSATAAVADVAGMLGTWTVHVNDGNRDRTLVVSEDSNGVRALFGVKGEKLYPIPAEITESGSLKATTLFGSVMVLEVKDKDALDGSFTTKAGKTSAAHATRGEAASQTVAGATAAATGSAAPSLLPRDEVVALATGKRWNFSRAQDGSSIVWDLREGGNLFATNRSANARDAGTWLVNDKGHLCVKWRGNSSDRCVAVSRDGDKYRMFDSANLKVPFAELVVE